MLVDLLGSQRCGRQELQWFVRCDGFWGASSVKCASRLLPAQARARQYTQLRVLHNRIALKKRRFLMKYRGNLDFNLHHRCLWSLILESILKKGRGGGAERDGQTKKVHCDSINKRLEGGWREEERKRN